MAPRRFEIEPSCIGDVLPDTFILERQDAGNFVYRLAGTRLCDLFKREFRGHNFLDKWASRDSHLLRSRLNTISIKGGVVVLLAEAETAISKSVLMEILLLPLVHRQAIADRFLGLVSPLESPPWLCWEPIQSLNLVSDEIIWPDGHPQGESLAAADQASLSAQDRQSPFLPGVRHSRIVRSERRQFRVFDGGLSNSERAD